MKILIYIIYICKLNSKSRYIDFTYNVRELSIEDELNLDLCLYFDFKHYLFCTKVSFEICTLGSSKGRRNRILSFRFRHENNEIRFEICKINLQKLCFSLVYLFELKLLYRQTVVGNVFADRQSHIFNSLHCDMVFL